MFGDRCTKPHQTGMEQKWEHWVKETLNFLRANHVDTYEGGWNANSLEGMEKPKGKVMEIPQRLNIFQETINTRRAMFARKVNDFNEEKDEHKATREMLAEATALIERCYVNSAGGFDAKESLEVAEALEVYAKEHLPHLFEEEDADDDDQRSA
jgi:hypothetical protein